MAIYEDTLDYLFDEVVRPFQTSHKPHKPLEGQQIYISSASMHDSPFAKMVKEYLKTIKENENE